MKINLGGSHCASSLRSASRGVITQKLVVSEGNTAFTHSQCFCVLTDRINSYQLFSGAKPVTPQALYTDPLGSK